MDASVTYQKYHPGTTIFTGDAEVLLLKRKMVDRMVELSATLEVPPVFVESLTEGVTCSDAQNPNFDTEETEQWFWEDELDKEWEVKKILAHCVQQDGKIMYLLEWEGWDEPTVCHKHTLFTKNHRVTNMFPTVGE